MTDVPNHGQSREDWDAYYLEVSRLAAARAAWTSVMEDEPASLVRGSAAWNAAATLETVR